MSSKRFYNAGDRIDEVFLFSLPDGPDGHVIGHWNFHALKESFLEVPDTIMAQHQEIHVTFAQDIARRFGVRGLVLIDPRHKPGDEDPEKDPPAIAPTDELAIERGRELWKSYTLSIVQNHLNDCESARAAGGAPRAAMGFTRRCLKLNGVTDPAQQYLDALREGRNPAVASDAVMTAVASMQASQNQMMALVLAIASGQKIEPELVRQLMPQPAPGGTIPQSGTAPQPSGVATGKTAKHVEARDQTKRETGLEVYDRSVKSRKDRAKAAAAAI
ncbi:MAG TPA: hypothetical protein VKU44_05875 [Terriglobia bacterium]|nr:hypothetical protein [Terriglobia bacterium]